jgi:P4 family phage/plasmid primase-like protien
MIRHSFVSGKMNIIDFCQARNIRWQPIQFRPSPANSTSVSKIPTRVTDSRGKSWTPKTSDYYGEGELSANELLYRQMHYPGSYDHIILDTSSIQQIDIDAPELLNVTSDLSIQLMEHGPWYNSANKRLPHIFVHLENASGYGKRMTAGHDNRIDILNGQWSIARKDEVVINPEANIPHLPANYLRQSASSTSRNPMVPNRVNRPTRSLLPDRMGIEIDKLLGKMSIERSTTYNTWIDVGIALKCIGHSSDNSLQDADMLDRWIRWSTRANGSTDTATAADCLQKWATFDGTRAGMTIGSLKFWAREDTVDNHNTTGATTVVSSSVMDGLLSTTTDHDIATQIANVYKNQYVTVSVPGGKFNWYEFTNNRWVDIGMTPVSLDLRISTDICHALEIEIARVQANTEASFEELCELTNRSANSIANLRERFNLTGAVADLVKVHTRLRTQSNKSNIIKECAILFSDSKFLDKLDENHHLIGFNNGVFDLDLMEFREGLPSDYISFTTGYEYTPVIDPIIRAEILRFKHDIMSSDEMTEYLLTTEAYALHGDTWIQNMFVHTGRGGNGKSVNGVLLRKTFGDYFYAPDISMFTGRKSAMSGGSSSELAKAKGKRLLMSTEPEAGDTLQAARIKYYTGGEMIQARALYKLPIEFMPQFTIHLQMNQLPSLSNHDGGIARRLKIVPYTFQFTDTPTMPHQKKMDRTMLSRFNTDAFAQQNMIILLEYFDTRLRGQRDLIYPTEASEFTEEYMAEEDIVGTFLQECCQVTNDRNDKVSASELFAHYKSSPHARGEINSTQFGRKLRELGVMKVRTHKGYIYRGVKIMHEGGLSDVDE